MQRSGGSSQNVANFFSSSFFGGGGKSRPGTSGGENGQSSQMSSGQIHNVLTKERKGSYGRKTSFSNSSPGKSSKRRANSSSNGGTVVTDPSAPPALPEFALAAAAKISRETEVLQSPASTESFSRILGKSAITPTGSFAAGSLAPVLPSQIGEFGGIHGNIHEMANKRIATLDYLQRAHEGRVFWFNTYMFERPDTSRMSAAAAQKLARRATNFLLLGISLPTVIDLNSSTPLEFLRSLNTLLSEFESFQQLHGEGGSAGSLSRARLPNMFRRGPSSKSRRSGSSSVSEIGYPADTDAGSGGMSFSAPASASVVALATSESDLLPGEAYTHLLTPSLPFDPDFFETYATLCDVLIDCYKRLLLLLPSPRECTAPVAEQFAKADAKVRKIVIQGTMREFEDNTRNNIRAEMTNISKIVLGGLV